MHDNEKPLRTEIIRLNKIIQALMNRAERNTSIQGSDFNLFQTAIMLEGQVHLRTVELENAREETERITRALRESEHRHRLLIENSPVSIHEIDLAGRLISMNRAGLLMLGAREECEVLGLFFLDTMSSEDRERVGELLVKALAGETSHFEFKSNGPEGKIFKSCFVPIKDKNGGTEKLMGITEDITERKKAEEQVRKLAYHDTLTNLPNRRLLVERLGQAMAVGKRSNRYGAVMFLDLDKFKAINDTHGHDVGDLLLIEVGRRISCCLREIDSVARFGGDEFVVMLRELDEDEKISRGKAGCIAERIRIALEEPYLLKRTYDMGKETVVKHHCSSSIGVVLFRGHDIDQEDIFKRADVAMYQAKTNGRNMVCFYEEKPHTHQGSSTPLNTLGNHITHHLS